MTAYVERALLPANSIPKAKTQPLLFFLLGAPIFAEVFLFPNFFPDTFAATISYDSRINSFNSSVCRASSRSNITHLYLPTYGAG
jgi:hypothetical protein